GVRRADRPVAALRSDDERRGGPDATGPRRPPFELFGAEERVGVEGIHGPSSWNIEGPGEGTPASPSHQQRVDAVVSAATGALGGEGNSRRNHRRAQP